MLYHQKLVNAGQSHHRVRSSPPGRTEEPVEPGHVDVAHFLVFAAVTAVIEDEGRDGILEGRVPVLVDGLDAAGGGEGCDLVVGARDGTDVDW